MKLLKGGRELKVDLKIDSEFNESKLIIESPEMTEEIEAVLKFLKHVSKRHIIGSRDEKMYILDPDNIFFFYSENKKIIAQTRDNSYEIKEKLYELEEQFENTSFIRISKSVIANVDKIKNLEMFFNGTMCVNFTNGKQEYVSRKYVTKIKEYLSIGGK